VTQPPALVTASRAAALAVTAAVAVAACTEGTTPTCPETEGGCSYAPVESGAFGDGGSTDSAQAGEGAPDASE
jgi:hypothetical protein